VKVELAKLWQEAVRTEIPGAVELRHRLHADPRISGQEEDTAVAVTEAIGCGPGKVVAGTGRLIDITGVGPRVVVVRAELDALPVVELTGAPWRSGNLAMHACGHDVHLAALTAVVRAAAEMDLPARLVALLQPREEGTDSGARDVVDEGWTADWDGIVAAHVQPQLPRGVIGVTPGPVNAATAELTIEVTGRGGHSGYPHTVDDSVLALSSIVVALQQLGSRRINPVHGCAMMINQLNAGSAANVVPPRAVARGTIRTMTVSDTRLAEAAMRDIVHHVAAAHGCEGILVMHPAEPVLANDPVYATSAGLLLAGLGHEVDSSWRSFGSDDFSHFSSVSRGLMMFVGTGSQTGGLHDASYLPHDDDIALVADALIAGYCAVVG